MGNEIQTGDTVAIIYHPEAYRFSVEPAIIKEVLEKPVMINTQLLKKNSTASFKPDESGSIYKKLAKIDPAFPEVAEGTPVDAVGHIIQIGDQIVCKRPVELGNTLKGFEKGGVVERLTANYVFYKDMDTGESKRKAFNGVVVI